MSNKQKSDRMRKLIFFNEIPYFTDIFLQYLILSATDVLLSILNGFFFVIAQIIFLSLNLFFASLEIAKCPL